MVGFRLHFPPPENNILDLWHHLFGTEPGFVCISRVKHVPGSKQKNTFRKANRWHDAFFPWPDEAPAAAAYVLEQNERNFDVYHGCHLLTAERRTRATAAPIRALWADADNGVPPEQLCPTALVQSSPGRFHAYLRLSRAIDPAVAEGLNKRLALAYGADPSGADLSQVLRPPNTTNFTQPKYLPTTPPGRRLVPLYHPGPDYPVVALLRLDPAAAYDPAQLDTLLPPLPPAPERPPRTPRGESPPATARLHAHEPRATPHAADRQDGGASAPPVLLTAMGRATWNGEHPKYRRDTGTLDRSATLLAIGRALYDAGATRPTLVLALRERDETLWFRKFCDRPDADEQYHRIVDELEKHGRHPQRAQHARRPLEKPQPLRTPAVPAAAPPSGAAPLAQRRTQQRAALARENAALRDQLEYLTRTCEVLRARVETAERAAEELRMVNRLLRQITASSQLSILANPAIAVSFEIAEQTAHGKADGEGWVPTSRRRIGRQYGAGDSSVTRHLERLEALGFLERRTETAVTPASVNAATGEIAERRPDSQLWIRHPRQLNTLLSLLTEAAALPPAAPQTRRGGRREARREARPRPSPTPPEDALRLSPRTHP